MRILFVTPMWPGPADPDFGSFLVPIVRELERLGHEVEVVAISRRAGGPRRHLRMAMETIRAARRTRPDVVFAHMLFPAGLAALVGGRLAGAPVVVMAHGQDVANLDRLPLRAATAPVLRWADGLIAACARYPERSRTNARHSGMSSGASSSRGSRSWSWSSARCMSATVTS